MKLIGDIVAAIVGFLVIALLTSWLWLVPVLLLILAIKAF